MQVLPGRPLLRTPSANAIAATLAPGGRSPTVPGDSAGALSEPGTQLFPLAIQPTGHQGPACLGCGSCWDCCAMVSLGSSTVAMIRVFSMMIVCNEVRASARPTILAYAPSQLQC